MAHDFLWPTGRSRWTTKAKALLTPEASALLGMLAAELAAVDRGRPRRPKQAVRAFAERKGVKLGAVAQPLRAALTGRTTRPGFSKCWPCSAKPRAWRALPIRPTRREQTDAQPA